MDLAKEWTSVDLKGYDRVLIIAPHQDDETLGCGGLIQRFAKMGSMVTVVYTTDGSMSHPNSKAYGSRVRSKIRNEEALAALQLLGVNGEKVHFMKGKDSALPNRDELGYMELTARLSHLVDGARPQLLLAPCQFDPHRDHRASWSMAYDISVSRSLPLWEYPIWIYHLGNSDDWLAQQKKYCCYLKLSAKESDTKMEALGCHRSQLDRKVFDDENGFLLDKQVIEYFKNGREYFFKGK